MLQRAEEPQPVVGVALERAHGVDDVLHACAARQRPVLGDVPDEDGGHPVLPREACEPRRALAHLRDRPGRARQIRIEQGLHGVDREDVGPQRLHVGDDVRERRLGDQPQAGFEHAEALGSLRTCCGDSSAPTSRHRVPDAARRPRACSSSVDLPIPGSPPSSVVEPSVKPPPSTRSSSPIPVARRGTPDLGHLGDRRGPRPGDPG